YVTNIGDELDKRVSLDPTVLSFYRNYISENPFDAGDGWYCPPSQKQPVLSEDFVRAAAQRCKKAIYIICRTVGESFDCSATPGSWYLSEGEEQNLGVLSASFENLIVLINSGNLIDMSWVKKYGVGTVAYVWQGGQEGGRGTVDALMGDVTPSGRLSDTIAASIDDYPSTKGFPADVTSYHTEDIFVGYRYFETFAPEKVLYPFGYGLSYTAFSHVTESVVRTGDTLTLTVRVKNIGKHAGRDVAQIYFSAPQGALGKPARQLIAFKKTKTLLPGEEDVLTISANINDMASYDDTDDARSGYAYSYVLEAGRYSILEGKNVREAREVFAFEIAETVPVRRCVQALAPTEDFERMIAKDGKVAFEPAPEAKERTIDRIARKLPEAIALTGDCGITLNDVKAGKATLDAFVAQFDAEALMALVCGEGMSSPKAPIPGTASCFCGVTHVWNDKDVPVVTTCDGPSGVRMESSAKATCIPSGTLLACSWLPDELDALFDCFADEILQYNVDVILAPGMNIHRNPLCGRNFEYFSEDPYLTGRCAATIAQRMTQKGVFCTLKHFAVNSQETKRHSVDEVLSERALRELYVKGFEIAVKSGYVRSIMTSYNQINGHAAGACYDLTTTLLREEWGYDSFVMTDWWPRLKDLRNGSFVKENLAEMVKAQNDVFMCTGDALTFEHDMRAAYADGYLTLGELQRCAKNLLCFSMQTPAFTAGRKIDVDTLDKYSNVVYTHDLANEPSLPYELEKRYVTVPRKRVSLSLEKDALYCAELTYCTNDDALKQRNILVYLDKCEPTRLTCSGTSGKVASLRFKLYLHSDSILYFEGDGLVELKLLTE
ncbi:MAG: glycoside hydrolase family 3 C-terminal domain-containing protein, partial [Clostridia bacterium]|nr:glycoside hydrolase family 3 C-terminal domain-containing protein [Clostridia bacterium]